MGMVKTSITIPEDILEQSKELSDNFSSVVAEALREYLRRKRIEKAINSFGKWEMREGDSVCIVNNLRSDQGRAHADHNS